MIRRLVERGLTALRFTAFDAPRMNALWVRYLTKRGSIRVWVRFRSLSHFAAGPSWYSDPTVRDIGLHLLVISVGIKWSTK